MFSRLLGVVVTVLAACVAGDFGGFTEPFFPTSMIDQALIKFYQNTKGPTQWPEAYRTFWDDKPCAWDGNERANPSPFGTRCMCGGWNPCPPKGVGGLMYLEHFSGMAEGPLPDEFKACQTLDHISLWNNKLTGPIWNTSYHQFLHRFDLSHNKLSGELGRDFLQRNDQGSDSINLSYNELSGELPPTLNNLVTLTSLQLNNNKFTGSIPDISHLTKLTHLDLSNNQISGTIGNWFSQLKLLAWAEFDNTNIEGELPAELPPNLSRFTASNTKLKGKIPESYANAGKLRYFICENCQLECPRPDLLAHVHYSTHCKPPNSRNYDWSEQKF